MQRGKITKLSVYEDKLTAMSERANGSNLDAVAFNLTLLSSISNQMASEVVSVFNRVRKLRV